MEQGKLYFLKDEYLENYNLPQNKGAHHDRPFFCSIQDQMHPEISWVIPLTSQVEQYEEKYDNYISKIGRCDVIDFTYIMNRKSALSIKNAFPVTDKYVKNKYTNPITGEDIKIRQKDQDRIERKLRKLIHIQGRGCIVFYNDVMEMKQDLLKESLSRNQVERNTLYNSPFEKAEEIEEETELVDNDITNFVRM